MEIKTKFNVHDVVYYRDKYEPTRIMCSGISEIRYITDGNHSLLEYAVGDCREWYYEDELFINKLDLEA